jgi:hypothetical protein
MDERGFGIWQGAKRILRHILARKAESRHNKWRN